MGLDEDVICFQSPGGCLRLAESINLILWLKGSDFVVEFKNCPHPVPSRRHMVAPTCPKPAIKPSTAENRAVCLGLNISHPNCTPHVLLNLGLHHTSLQCQL